MPDVSRLWFDGKIVRESSARVSILAHALHYGGAVFEGIRIYRRDGARSASSIFRLNDHLERLFYSAAVLGMKIPYTRKKLRDAAVATVRATNVREGYIRPIIFWGHGKMGLYPSALPVHAGIAAFPWGAYLGNREAVSVHISRFVRNHPRASFPDAKIAGHYVNSILATQDARKKGYDEAILLDHEGYVSEGSGENIFMVRSGVLVTPRRGNILPGITRDTVMALARAFGMNVEERAIRPEELKRADEVFFTGTAAEVTAIGRIDRTTIGNGKRGPTTALLAGAYADLVRGKRILRKEWLTPVTFRT